MAMAVLGLGLTIALLPTVTLWTVDEITQQEYQERLNLAVAIASHVDRALGAELKSVDQAAQDTAIPPSPQQRRRLEDLAVELGGTARVWLSTADGARSGRMRGARLHQQMSKPISSSPCR
jgi:hypothetical protein